MIKIVQIKNSHKFNVSNLCRRNRESGNVEYKTGLRHLREIKITINRRNAGFFMSNFIYFYVVRSCILSLYVI